MNTQQSYTTNFSVDQTPEEVFTAINNVRGWWSENVEGATDQVGVSYKYRFRDLHRCEIEVTELVVGKRVAWHVAENYFSFTDDDTEWKDTDMVFDIARRDGRTEVRFTHVGLVPENECYDACTDGWRTYINGSLKALIETGKGNPNIGEAITGSELTLAGAE